MSENVFRFLWRVWFFMGLGGTLCSAFFALIYYAAGLALSANWAINGIVKLSKT